MKVVTDAVAQTVELCSEGCGRTRKGLNGSARGGATQPRARLADLLMLPRAADVARFLTAKEGHKFNLQPLSTKSGTSETTKGNAQSTLNSQTGNPKP